MQRSGQPRLRALQLVTSASPSAPPTPMIIATKPPTQRDPGPYAPKRACPDCGAQLSRSNPGPRCAPCNGGDWTADTELTTRQLHDVEVARLEYGLAA